MAPAKSRTRSGAKATPKTAAEALEATSSTSQKTSLPKESSNPPKLFILPKDISSKARILSIQDSRYLCCPTKGFYEFTKTGASKSTPRSFLLAPTSTSTTAETSKSQDEADPNLSKGWVNKSADLFIATPIDPIFLLLPILTPTPTKSASEPPKQLFLSFDDHLDNLISQSPHLRPLLQTHSSLRILLESRMSAICDTVDAGDESMYRLSHSKLLSVLVSKAQRMIEGGLPASMEEKLVRKALEKPLLSIKRDEVVSGHELLGEEDSATSASTPATAADSQSSVETQDTAVTSLDSEDENVKPNGEKTEEKMTPTRPPIDAPEGIPTLQRLHTAFLFLLSRYIPSTLHTPLKTLLFSPPSSTSTISTTSTTTPTIPDFTPLTTHLTHLQNLRATALLSREVSQNYSTKRSYEDDEEASARAEKKRKLEEEEKRAKANVSRGVRDLKKVNVSGMKKMSDFFKKKV